MKRMPTRCLPVFSLATLLFGFWGIAYGEIAEEVRAITDPNTRIVVEMEQGWVGRTPDEIEERKQSALATLERQSLDEPNDVGFFHLLFNRNLSNSEVLYALENTFLYVSEIVIKEYDPVANDVWTHSVSDYEMYKGTAAEKLDFLIERLRLQITLASQNRPKDQLDESVPPLIFKFDVYELKGYVNYQTLQNFSSENASSILHLQESTPRISYQNMQALLEAADKRGVRPAVPVLPAPQASTRSEEVEVRDDLEKVLKNHATILVDTLVNIIVPSAQAASYSPCGPATGGNESLCPPDNTYNPTYANFNGYDYTYLTFPIRVIQTLVKWETALSQASFKDTTAPPCHTPLGGLTSRCRTVPAHTLADNVVYVDEGFGYVAIENKVHTPDPVCSAGIRSGTWADYLLFNCMYVHSMSSNMPAAYDDYTGSDSQSDFIASVGSLAPHLFITGHQYANYSNFIKPAYSLVGLTSKQSVSVNVDHFHNGSPVNSILIVDSGAVLRQHVWKPVISIGWNIGY